MTPIELEIIRRKLSSINENLDLLRPLADMSYDEYVKKVYQRKAVERLLQTIIEAAIDVNTHLLVGSGLSAPEDYYQSFIDIAQKLEVIEPAFAEELAPSAGLRNRLVHEYDKLDDAVVFASMKKILTTYPRYVQAVAQYIQKNTEPGA